MIHVTYKGGEPEYTLSPELPVLAYLPAERSLLKAGAAVLLIARTNRMAA